MMAVVPMIWLLSCRDSPGTPPNLVLITIDTLRADRLGAYGDPQSLTPNLDRLAEEGVLFERAYSPIGTTHPSHASMLTGLYPRYHGVRWNGGTLPPEAQTVAEILQSNGYSTGSFVSYPALHFRARLDQGFDAASDLQRPKGKKAGLRSCKKTNALVFAWLEELTPEPFFLWVHYFEPHRPYRLRSYSAREFSARGYTGPLSKGSIRVERDPEIIKYIRDTEEGLEAYRTLYDGEVQEADRCVGELIEAVRAGEFLDNTLVVATGDHGEGLGEHKRWGHSGKLWDSVLQVPLILRDYRESRARRVSELVGLVDLTPTLLELAGQPVIGELQGRSLVPILRGDRLRRQIYFAEMALEPRNGSHSGAIAVLAGRFKQISQGDEHRLFNREEDPEEIEPLSLEKFREISRRMSALATEFAEADHRSASTELRREDIEELRALGYL